MTLRKPYVDVNGMMLPLPPGDTIATTGGGDSPFINSATQFQFFDDFFLPQASTNSVLNTYELNTIIPGWEINFSGSDSHIYTGGALSDTAVGFNRIQCGVQSTTPEIARIVRGRSFDANLFDYELEVRIDQQTLDYTKINIFITLSSTPEPISITTGGAILNDQWYLIAGGSSYALGAHNSGSWKKFKIKHARGTPNTLRYYYNDNLIGSITTAYALQYSDLRIGIQSVADDNPVSYIDVDYVSLSFLNMTR